jgi:hypothetical protein
VFVAAAAAAVLARVLVVVHVLWLRPCSTSSLPWTHSSSTWWQWTKCVVWQCSGGVAVYNSLLAGWLAGVCFSMVAVDQVDGTAVGTGQCRLAAVLVCLLAWLLACVWIHSS